MSEGHLFADGPEGATTVTSMRWTLWTRQEDGKIILVNGSDPRAQQRVELDPDDIPSLAVALANHCPDNDERAFVRDEWGEIWDDEEGGSDE